MVLYESKFPPFHAHFFPSFPSMTESLQMDDETKEIEKKNWLTNVCMCNNGSIFFVDHKCLDPDICRRSFTFLFGIKFLQYLEYNKNICSFNCQVSSKEMFHIEKNLHKTCINILIRL